MRNTDDTRRDRHLQIATPALLKLEVQGTTFSLYKDGSLILTGSDNDWSSGKTYGIGIYNAYNTYSFHIDDLLLETCEPLCYVNVVTVTSTEISTLLGTTTTTSTSQITQIELVTNTHRIAKRAQLASSGR